MKLHIVMPYQSMAMQRMAAPLLTELPKLYTVTMSETPDSQADLNYHIPWHTLTGELEGRHAMLYTHCNPGAEGKLIEACNAAERIVCMSFAGRQELISLGVDPSKLWCIYASTETKFNKRIIGVVGYPQPNGRKREGMLLDLAWQTDLSPFEFLLVGKGWEQIAAQLQSLGMSATAIYIDAETDLDEKIGKLYGLMDTLLVTGYVEGGPLPLLEAMQCGTKVLSPRFGYAADLLDDEYLYGDLPELIEKLNRGIENRINNHRLIRSWTWKDYAAEHALLFGRMLGESVDLYPEVGASRYAQLLDIIDEEKPCRILEVGTWKGNRAIQMIQEAAKFWQIESVSYKGFDLFGQQTAQDLRRELSKGGWPFEIVERRIKATGAAVTLCEGDTKHTLRGNAQADFYFVDGGHSEETIQNDGEIVLSALQNGVAVFDDYYREGKPDGMGCNKFIDGLPKEYFEVTHLPVTTKADDGRVIGMVKVRRNADIRVQMPERTYARSYSCDDRISNSYMPLQNGYVESSAGV